jgi:hypothetical protein
MQIRSGVTVLVALSVLVVRLPSARGDTACVTVWENAEGRERVCVRSDSVGHVECLVVEHYGAAISIRETCSLTPLASKPTLLWQCFSGVSGPRCSKRMEARFDPRNRFYVEF